MNKTTKTNLYMIPDFFILSVSDPFNQIFKTRRGQGNTLQK
ncbi:hypothetical protein Lser_V15G11531 [Lactuca serriola]